MYMNGGGCACSLREEGACVNEGGRVCVCL